MLLEDSTQVVVVQDRVEARFSCFGLPTTGGENHPIAWKDAGDCMTVEFNLNLLLIRRSAMNAVVDNNDFGVIFPPVALIIDGANHVLFNDAGHCGWSG